MGQVDQIIYHYPPEIVALLKETIPLLSKSKRDVILFFRGAGVSSVILDPLETRLTNDPKCLNKYEIARIVLQQVNEGGDVTLRERREIIKRVIEFEDFSTCWPDDQLKAKGLVSEIRRVVNVKDSFTRIQQERDEEKKRRQEIAMTRQKEIEKKHSDLQKVRQKLLALFSLQEPAKRGKQLEDVLNELFNVYGIAIREAFTIKGNQGEGIIEQIDGLVSLDGDIYLVEMKWWSEPIGTGDIAQHIVRLFARDGARGIFISASSYTAAAIQEVKSALRNKILILCSLDEFVLLLEREVDLRDFFREKVENAVAQKNPFTNRLIVKLSS